MMDVHTITTFTCDGQTYVPLEDYQRVAMAIEAAKREAYAEGLEDVLTVVKGMSSGNPEGGDGDDILFEVLQNIEGMPNKYGAKE